MKVLNLSSIKIRFIVSVGANGLRAFISFLSGLLIARGLSPSGYGDLTFLLGSFVAVRSLIDMGSSGSFYTFISQRPRNKKFYLSYFGWLAIQFALTFLAVAVILPRAIVDSLWLGHSRTVVLLAFAAVYLQQHVWQTVMQVGESSRKTVIVQLMSVTLAVVNLGGIVSLLAMEMISIELVFWLIVIQYFIAILCSLWFLRNKEDHYGEDPEFSFNCMLREYAQFCKPLMLYSLFSFVYEFVDRWVLQRYGGASQQGFYQIAYQFSAASLLATNSVLNIFWKEIAEAYERLDRERVEYLYLKVNRGLVILSAALSGFFIPWAGEIVTVLLGKPYLSAVPVLTVMLFYPIYQSMGFICTTMFMATNRTRTYMKFGITMMIVSLPISYLVQAPRAAVGWVPGLELGAIGMALKTVILTVIFVNAQVWVIARQNSWKFDWVFQAVGIGLLIATGYFVKFIASLIWNTGAATNRFDLFYPFLFSGFFYTIIVMALIWLMPWLIGTEREYLNGIVKKIKSYLFFRS